MMVNSCSRPLQPRQTNKRQRIRLPNIPRNTIISAMQTSDMVPLLSLDDVINLTRGYSISNSHVCDRIWSLTYFHNHLRGKLRSWLPLSPQIYQAITPLHSGIFRQSAPFKILRSIVQFITINMVDRKKDIFGGNERQSYKSMNKIFSSFIADFYGYAKIAVFTYPWGQLPTGTFLCPNDSILNKGRNSGFRFNVSYVGYPYVMGTGN